MTLRRIKLGNPRQANSLLVHYHAREGAPPMHRNLQNLERLIIKFQTRYGHEDDVVLKIREALETRASQTFLDKRWNAHYPRSPRRIGGRLAYIT
jgi:hypothetical protein